MVWLLIGHAAMKDIGLALHTAICPSPQSQWKSWTPTLGYGPPMVSIDLCGKQGTHHQQGLDLPREHDRSSRHASRKAEGCFKDIDMWPIIIRVNIQPGADSGERLMAYAKRCGGPMMLEFCFHNWDKLQRIVERSWKVEKVEEFIDFPHEVSHANPAKCKG